VLALMMAVALPGAAQRDRQGGLDRSEAKFFEQLRSLFGRFRDTELRRAFRTARPIRCAELTSGNGEWHPVAFFNEDLKLGAWFHRSLEEVNGDLSVYTFKGECAKEQDSLQVLTRFPVKESLDRYYDSRIKREDVVMNEHPPVTATYNARSQGYKFELPYLYSVRGEVYSLVANRRGDRVVTTVSNHWDCKAVTGNDVTFSFLICETATLPRNLVPGKEGEQSFGTYAYFILSDGKEAQTSIQLSFGAPGGEATPPVSVPVERGTLDTSGTDGWQKPAPASKLAEADSTEFRIRFNAQAWTSKIGSPQLLTDKKLSSADAAKPPARTDCCSWSPASAALAPRALGNDPDANVSYSLTTRGDAITFDLKTHNGTRLGSLQCSFPGANTAEIPFDRWLAVVGENLAIEIRP